MNHPRPDDRPGLGNERLERAGAAVLAFCTSTSLQAALAAYSGVRRAACEGVSVGTVMSYFLPRGGLSVWGRAGPTRSAPEGFPQRRADLLQGGPAVGV